MLCIPYCEYLSPVQFFLTPIKILHICTADFSSSIYPIKDYKKPLAYSFKKGLHQGSFIYPKFVVIVVVVVVVAVVAIPQLRTGFLHFLDPTWDSLG